MKNTHPRPQPLDALSTQHAVQELHALFCGAKVQKINQYSPTDFSFHLWQPNPDSRPELERGVLYICLHKQTPFFALLTPLELQELFPTATFQSPLLLSLRKYVQGARLDSAQSIDGEPAFRLDFHYTTELGFRASLTLVVEMIGKYSNVFLLEGETQKVLSLLNVVTPEQSQLRPLQVGSPYRLPPRPQGKTPWATLDLAELWQHIDTPYSAEQAFESIKAVGWGIAKTMALPLLERVDCFDDAREALHQWQKHPQGVLFYDDDGALKGFHGVNYTGTGQVVGSFLQAMSVYYASCKRQKLWEDARQHLRKPLMKKLYLLEKGVAQLNTRVLNRQTLEELQAKGDVLMTLYSMRYFTHAKPFENIFTPDVNPLTGQSGEAVDVDVKKTWLENAQAYYRLVQKAKGRQAFAEEERLRLENAVAFYKSLAVLLDNAESREDLHALQVDWQEAGLLKAPLLKGRKGKATPKTLAEEAGLLKLTSPEGLVIWVGKSSKANGQLIQKQLRPKDWWVHVAEGLSGSHVVVKVHGTPWADSPSLPLPTLAMATALAAWYSEARHSVKVPVLYTRGKYVRPIPQSWAGHVNYSHETAVVITPQKDGF
jgi:predicted ribosome quality control (RQC) complex YloA/Tae2 family protein